jgi:hypothetical protein
MNRYHNGKIYKLVNSVDDRIYIGSTATELSKRLYQHKSMAHKYPERKVYKELNTIGWENVRIIEIEAFRCETKNSLLTREQYHMDLLKPDLNKYASSGQTCIHNKRRPECIPCGGSAICIHNKQRTTCIPCGGSAICIHNKQRTKCIPCGGSAICIHNTQRAKCIPCGGSELCIHNKQLQHCKICSPAICELCDITTSKGCFKQHIKSENHKNMVLLSAIIE